MIIPLDYDCYKPTIARAIISVSQFQHQQGLPTSLPYRQFVPDAASILRATKHSQYHGFQISSTELASSANRYLKESRWGQACREMFYELVETDADVLFGLIRSRVLKPSTLTFAAETLGQAKAQVEILELLLELLKHDSPVVREGAIYGLSVYHAERKVREELRRIASQDANVGVREAALEALGE